MRASYFQPQEGHGRCGPYYRVEERHAPLRVHADTVLVVEAERLGGRRQYERVLQERELSTYDIIALAVWIKSLTLTFLKKLFIVFFLHSVVVDDRFDIITLAVWM